MKIIRLKKHAMWPFPKKDDNQSDQNVNTSYDPTAITPEQSLEQLKDTIKKELMRVGYLEANTSPNGTRGYFNTELHYAFEDLYNNNPQPNKWEIYREPRGDKIFWRVTSRQNQ